MFAKEIAANFEISLISLPVPEGGEGEGGGGRGQAKGVAAFARSFRGDN